VDPAAIEAAITPRARAIMPVHVNGRVCAMDEIAAIAEKHGLLIVEDAAQAVGAKFDGKAAGRFGAWGGFSFYPSKTLGCFGDAGALVTDDENVAEAVRSMRNHGAGADKRIPVDCAIWGTNSRLDNIHAAILRYKLSYYAEAIERRREIARLYDDAFSGISELILPPGPDADERHFDIFQNYEVCTEGRDALRDYLAQRAIGTIVQWGGTAIHQFRGLGFTQSLPVTERFFRQSLLLPMNHILTEAQVQHVIASVREFFQ
jgi:dTDP-4-amino-4,6-dideoxygalactose transaminase